MMIAFHPGYYIKEIADEFHLSGGEIAEMFDIPIDEMNDLLDGKARVTDEIAQKLSSVLGTSKELWLNLDRRFREVERMCEQDDST